MKTKNSKEIKIIFTSSVGGHFSELMELKEIVAKYDSTFVVEKSENIVSTLEKEKDENNIGKSNVEYLRKVSRKNIFSYLLNMIINLFLSIIYFIKINPDVIISTGSGSTILLMFLGKMFNKKVIYIETFASIKKLSMTGKFALKFSTYFLIKHKELKKLEKEKLKTKICYFGEIINVIEKDEENEKNKEDQELKKAKKYKNIFVILGTQKHDFSRLIGYVNRLVNEKIISNAIIQVGESSLKNIDDNNLLSKKIVAKRYISNDEYDHLIKNADFCIIHGGVGSIHDVLNSKKKAIVVARKKLLKEHINDHQEEIVNKYAENNLLMEAKDYDELKKCIQNLQNFKFNQLNLDNSKFLKNLNKIIKE